MLGLVMRIGVVLSVLAILTGCERPNPPYRTTLDDAICAQDHLVAGVNFELVRHEDAPPLSRTDIERLRKCPHQRHVLPPSVVRLSMDAEDDRILPAALGLADNEWTRLAAQRRPSVQLGQSDSYHLSFVEMEETENDLSALQTQVLTDHLKRQDRAGLQNVVVLYVHGWRHDAALSDGDVRKFRRLLGYTRAALNTRCITNGTYCNAVVTGVFASWRGRMFDEGESETSADTGAGGGLASIAPVLSFWNRYDRSFCLALGGSACRGQKSPDFRSPLNTLLAQVQARLALAPGQAKADKLLVVGHSMGGNILATMLLREAIETVEGHSARTEMAPIAGDLVVLLNPASPAANWSAIQMAERAKAGFAPEDSRLSCVLPTGQDDPACTEADRARLLAWHSLYPDTQRPIYVSLTATRLWGTLRDASRVVDYDKPTGRVFPLSRWAIGVSDIDNRVTIGHRAADYINRRAVNAPAVGTSHEMAVLEGALNDEGERFASSYTSSVSPVSAWCAPADGWLLEARRQDNGVPVRRNLSWDYGLGPPGPDNIRSSSRNVGGPFNKAAVQWRQGQYPVRGGRHLSVSPYTSPFWNTRVLDSAIRGHAGWANYATWCALTQLVLDDVTALLPNDKADAPDALAAVLSSSKPAIENDNGQTR